MSFKQRLLSTISHLPFVVTVVESVVVRKMLCALPGSKAMFSGGWDRTHHFDLAQGVDTSGYIPSEDLPTSLHARAGNHAYAGSQPGIVRAILSRMPSVETFTFIDLGCGKGRPLLVASEFPFRDIVGVELSPALVATAQSNAAIIKHRYPGRTAIRIEAIDAFAYNLPPGNLVIFLYNPFEKEVIAKIVEKVEAALLAEHRTIYVVYYNPVHGDCFDASPVLKRHSAEMMPYPLEDRGYGPDADDAVVSWQCGGDVKPLPSADRQIIVIWPGVRAELTS